MSEALLLTVDTATTAGSVALCRGTTLLGEFTLNIRSTHSDRLLSLIQQLLAATGVSLSQLQALGVVLGPGSFTGLRVGVATVKGLALALQIPVVGVSSLAALAMQVPYVSCPVCTLLDARKAEVYAGLFAWKGVELRPLRDEVVLPPVELLASLPAEEIIFVGNGALEYGDLIQETLGDAARIVPLSQQVPRAASAAPLALAALREKRIIPLEHLVPSYIRPSEAELAWRAKMA
ncbi:MAG: tRNA (adenosine(37)-N6)-threonylcarbamoyltransferase complex dimerization subunit type 1 TsaB [Desulfuromonadaceae bacterium]